jgi:hypothetical protein
MGRGQGTNNGAGGFFSHFGRARQAAPARGEVRIIGNPEDAQALFGQGAGIPEQQASHQLWQVGYQAFLNGDQQSALAAWMEISANERLAQGDALLGLHRFAPDNLQVSEALYQHRSSIGQLQNEFDAPLSSTVRPLGISARPLISADDAAIAYAINLAHHMRFDDAEAVLQENPQVETRLRQGAAARLAYERCDYETAVQLATDLAQDPEFGDESQLLIGAAYVRLGRLDEAVDAFEAVRDRDDADRTARTLSALLLAQIHAQHEEDTAAQALVQETLARSQPQEVLEAAKLAAELSLHPNEFAAADHLSAAENSAWRSAVRALESNEVITDQGIPDNDGLGND